MHRRKILVAAIFSYPTLSLASSVQDYWVDKRNGSNWLTGGHGIGSPLGDGQVGLIEHTTVAAVGATAFPVRRATIDGMELRRNKALDDINFAEAFANIVQASPMSDSLKRDSSPTEPAQGIRFTPLASLILSDAGTARLRLVLHTRVDLPGGVRFSSNCEVETADEALVFGDRSWTSHGAELLYERFRVHAPHALQLSLMEIDLRRTQKWKNPLDASRLERIEFFHFRYLLSYYLVLAESETHLLLVPSQNDMGHIFGSNRFVVDKRLLSSRRKLT